MTIQCKICQKVFDKQITNSHLKSHNITTLEYKNKWGEDSLTSEDYRTKLSESRSGEKNSNFGNYWSEEKKTDLSKKMQNKTPWNKDKKIGSTPAHLIGIKNREEKYKNGDLTRHKNKLSDDQKENLSLIQKEFLKNNPLEASRRAKKAVETKRKNNYDFSKSMLGKKHSDETKQKLSEKSKIVNEKKRIFYEELRLKKIKEAKLEIIEENEFLLELRCVVCNNVFNLTRQCFTDSKFKYTWCDICNPRIQSKRSKQEIELYNFVKNIATDAVSSSRTILERQELDIVVPSKKLAIEFNSLYWHSEDVLLANGKSKHSDWIKMKETLKNNLNYICVFEDEWLYKRSIVESRIANLLGVNSTRIGARKCELLEISSNTASKFCRENHIQSSGRSNVRYGLYYNNELVSVMTFTKTNISRKNQNVWEINRFCNLLHHSVVGAAGKLFNHFIKNYNPEKVISYSDNRWGRGNLYKTLGFKFEKETSPNYWYFLPNELIRKHRYSLRKMPTELIELTEKELRSMQGYFRIWDCGHIKWVWDKNTHPKLVNLTV
jgi:hypothetical protein